MIINDLGLVDYHEALRLQLELAKAVKAGERPATALILEHPPVITLGANKKLNMVHLPPPGVPVVQTRRGGGATVHNPGQLVLYPVANLKTLGLSVKAFVTAVLETGAALLAELDVPAEPRLDPLGLWVAERKIASMGVAVSRYVVTHGLAVNLNNDLGLFAAITPCGLAGVRMTSAALELGRPADMAHARGRLAQLLAERFPE